MQIKPGNLLVANPSLNGGLFSKSVILISEHHTKGSVGFILNKPSTYKVSDVIQGNSLDILKNETLYAGGPLNNGSLILVHSAEWYSSNTMPLPTNVSISSDHFMFEKISMGNLPFNYKLITGISGWQPGQLQFEVDKENWLICAPTDNVIYNHAGVTMWHQALELCASQVVASFF
tara:strand:- start:449 stop:976 length:528 start_codon:yes stop_codon:yes gene_type:complete